MIHCYSCFSVFRSLCFSTGQKTRLDKSTRELLQKVAIRTTPYHLPSHMLLPLLQPISKKLFHASRFFKRTHFWLAVLEKFQYPPRELCKKNQYDCAHRCFIEKKINTLVIKGHQRCMYIAQWISQWDNGGPFLREVMTVTMTLS